MHLCMYACITYLYIARFNSLNSHEALPLAKPNSTKRCWKVARGTEVPASTECPLLLHLAQSLSS